MEFVSLNVNWDIIIKMEYVQFVNRDVMGIAILRMVYAKLVCKVI